MSARDLLGAAAGAASKLYVDDVFSTYTYTGTGTTQTINNGIDLAGNGGLVWCKGRSSDSNHGLSHKNNFTSFSNLAAAETGTGVTFNSNGFTTAVNGTASNVGSGITHVSWTFRRAPKFFDVVTYTGDGFTDKALTHGLGIPPGLVIIKATSADSTNWIVQFDALQSSRQYLRLNTQEAAVATADHPTAISWNNASTVYVHSGWPQGAGNDLNTSGVTYVAYLFAHDPSADGIIQCGTYVGNGNSSGNLSVSLGFEPQFLLVKKRNGTIGPNQSHWFIMDQMRGMSDGAAAALYPDIVTTENPLTDVILPTVSGFTLRTSAVLANEFGATYVYMAIRRPNKPPKTGTEVYNAIARAGTGTATTVTGVGFAPDLLLCPPRNGYGGVGIGDRLQGSKTHMRTNDAAAAYVNEPDAILSFDQDGVSLGAANVVSGDFNYSLGTYINYFFKRAPGFFDVVCWTGDGTGILKQIPHGLGVNPELVITKARSAPYHWAVADAATASQLELSSTVGGSVGGNGGYSSASMFQTVWAANSSGQHNDTGVTYVSYLFATAPGISKVGNYTGNGTSLTLDCGFSAGARFILIKRTNSAGDWYVWDTARGIVAANDPHLRLNTTAAEITTDDSVDPHASGFIVNQVAATNVNVSGGTYIYLAIA